MLIILGLAVNFDKIRSRSVKFVFQLLSLLFHLFICLFKHHVNRSARIAQDSYFKGHLVFLYLKQFVIINSLTLDSVNRWFDGFQGIVNFFFWLFKLPVHIG